MFLMPLDIVIEYARNREEAPAVWIIDMFGEAQPCGQPEPEVHPGQLIITRDMVGTYTPEEAIAVAAMIIRGAEEARRRDG